MWGNGKKNAIYLPTFSEIHLFNGSSSSVSLDDIDASYDLWQELWDQVIGVKDQCLEDARGGNWASEFLCETDDTHVFGY